MSSSQSVTDGIVEGQLSSLRPMIEAAARDHKGLLGREGGRGWHYGYIQGVAPIRYGTRSLPLPVQYPKQYRAGRLGFDTAAHATTRQAGARRSQETARARERLAPALYDDFTGLR